MEKFRKFAILAMVAMLMSSGLCTELIAESEKPADKNRPEVFNDTAVLQRRILAAHQRGDSAEQERLEKILKLRRQRELLRRLQRSYQL